MKLIFIIITGFITGCAVSKDTQRKEVKQLQKGKVKEDTSYVYILPYENGSAYRVIQGYYSNFTHRNRVALDFKMKPGTKIVAARDGVIVRAQENNNKGGWKTKFRQYANYLVIEHDDGTRAGYWHLQQNGIIGNIGDRVKQGQVIGLSGNTGYTFLPHLHFMVWTNKNGQWQQIPTRFLTSKGPKYLRPLRKYRHNNEQSLQ